MSRHIVIRNGKIVKDSSDEAMGQALRLINQAGEILYKANLKDTKDPKVSAREAVLRKLLEARALASKE